MQAAKGREEEFQCFGGCGFKSSTTTYTTIVFLVSHIVFYALKINIS